MGVILFILGKSQVAKCYKELGKTEMCLELQKECMEIWKAIYPDLCRAILEG